jgi:hypothetical protein
MWKSKPLTCLSPLDATVESEQTRVAVLTQNKFQERLADDDLVAVVERLARSREKAWSSIDERAIRTTQVFDKELIVLPGDSRMPSRDFGFGIILIQVDIGEDASVRVPSTDQRLVRRKRKLLTDLPSTLNDQLRANTR